MINNTRHTTEEDEKRLAEIHNALVAWLNTQHIEHNDGANVICRLLGQVIGMSAKDPDHLREAIIETHHSITYHAHVQYRERLVHEQ